MSIETLQKLSVDQLRKQASKLQIKNYAKMSREVLEAAIIEKENSCRRVSFTYLKSELEGIVVSEDKGVLHILGNDNEVYDLKEFQVKTMEKKEEDKIKTPAENIDEASVEVKQKIEETNDIKVGQVVEFIDGVGEEKKGTVEVISEKVHIRADDNLLYKVNIGKIKGFEQPKTELELEAGQQVTATIKGKIHKGEVLEVKELKGEQYAQLKVEGMELSKLVHIADIKSIDGVKTIKKAEEKLIRKEPVIKSKPAKESSDVQRRDLFFINPSLIKMEKNFNTRFDYGDIDELKNSIIENGVRIPLRGYKEGEFYFLTDGHRRLVAVTKAIQEGNEIVRVPFISEKKRSLEERIFDILLSNDGKSLSPLELGETYRKLGTFGYNSSEISRKIGKTVKHVIDMISVAESSKELKEIIREDGISATLVAEVKAKVKDDQKAEEIIKTVHAIKKETGTGKVTKKDIEDQLPEQKKTSFTLEEVRGLLKKQIVLCSEGLEEEEKQVVLATSLVL